jgi:hypothetical protein
MVIREMPHLLRETRRLSLDFQHPRYPECVTLVVKRVTGFDHIIFLSLFVVIFSYGMCIEGSHALGGLFMCCVLIKGGER